jgi:hypothetical protein
MLQVASVPASAAFVGELPALLVIVKVPLAAPEAMGVKVTLSVALWPLFNVIGKVLPGEANGPEVAMLLTVTGPALLFETNRVCAGLGLLAAAIPKFKLPGAMVNSSEPDVDVPVP